MPQSLRPGETRTCFGCHDGHSIGRRIEIGVEPQEVFKKTLSYGTTPPLLAGTERVSADEVQVILEKSCGGCHPGFQKEDFWHRVFYDTNQVEWPWIKNRRVNYNGGTNLWRPNFSPLVSRYADWSPLYWYMEGKRTDGYTNADFTVHDVDYLETHPKIEITEEDKRKVVRYIDLGAPKIIPPGCDTPAE